MDTHIASRAEIQVEQPDAVAEIAAPPLRGRGLFRRGAAWPVEPEAPPPPAVEPAPRRRGGLMTTACVAAVLAVAGGVFWISPYNQATLADLRQAFTRVQNAAEAALPGAEAPSRAAAPTAPAAALARAPTPSRARPPAETVSATGGDDMARFLNFRGGETLAPALLAPSSKTPATVAVAATPALAAVAPVAPPASQAPQAVVPVSQAADPAKPGNEGMKPAASVVPADAVAVVAALRAVPMTEPQQVQVLELLTQLGTVVHDQRAEIAQLRLDQQHVGQRVDGSLADFNRRVALAEARGAVSSAMASPATGAAAAAQPTPATPPAAAAADTAPHRYHVQAASPGLAMLSELDASGGEQRQLPVSLGDPVPGLGKVVSIFQRGASWVVKTEHGLVQ